ncbi:hypothetical protein H1C71_032663 [Ictidomys tridecemlineatus]|nr:hypothetical protein H1C71_032663 [Ictidomys tridecemlineatus]KAG3282056.1 hypothetical protein H1C71_032663 [Ictidomys tridecemlineatus]
MRNYVCSTLSPNKVTFTGLGLGCISGGTKFNPEQCPLGSASLALGGELPAGLLAAGSAQISLAVLFLCLVDVFPRPPHTRRALPECRTRAPLCLQKQSLGRVDLRGHRRLQ